MKLNRPATYLGLIAITVLLSLVAQRATAQGEWSVPQVLLEPREGWSDQGLSLVADFGGRAHLAWLRQSEQDWTDSALYYSRWNGEEWTQPVDLVLASSWPVLVPSRDGTISMFWYDREAIYHSRAQATAANDLRSWSEPRAAIWCEESCSAQIDAKQSEDGVFHLAYTLLEGDCYYSRSEDGGETWSLGQPASAVGSGVTTVQPRIAVSDGGRVHLTWADAQLPDGDHLRLNYAHSTDGGRTWTPPLELGVGNYADGNILTTGDSEVHLVWNGGVGVNGRYYLFSADGGRTWTEAEQISSLGGRAGYPSIVQDSSGSLHILTADGEYVTQYDHLWRPPQRMPFYRDYLEHSRLAVVNGNQLVAITPPGFRGLQYTVMNLDTPPLHSEEYPRIVATATARTEKTVVYSETQDSEGRSTYAFSEQAPSVTGSASLHFPSILAAFASMLVIIVIVAARQLHWN